MSKKTPVLIEVGIGLALTLFVVFAHHRGGSVLETVSLKTYDALAGMTAPGPITDSVRILAIDQQSVETLGRWPWPRAQTAQLIDEVVSAGAKVVGLNVFLTDPDKNQGLEEISRLEESFKKILAEQKAIPAKKRPNTDDLQEFLDGDLANARANLDGDSNLSRSIEEAVNVVLPMYFVPGEALGNVDALPAYFERDRIPLPADAPAIPEGQSASLPLPVYGTAALAVGHANLAPDSDGTLRRIPPVVKYGNAAYPSFALQIVREFLKLQRSALKWTNGTGFELHNARIPTDDAGLTFVRYAGPAGTIKSYSALDVMSDGLPEKALQDKIVLIGLTAPGAADGAVMVAPGGQRITGLEIIANHIENILAKNYIQSPPWAGNVEWLFLGLAAFVVILVLPLMRAKFSIPVCIVVFLGIVITSSHLFRSDGFWVNPAYAASLLVLGFVVLVGKRLLFTERRKEMVEAEGLETNKMLGLSFQGQGMLDLAFEKFRRCPIDDAMKELLYNLGLDMERKRQFAKAAAVYEHIAGVDPKYKDLTEKIELLKKAGEGAIFGQIGKKGSDATVVVEGLGQSTTLGRYEVVKELGRGAMGIVYLGRDPKINRQVAIKTLRFTEETDEEAIKSTKERFFREAESAGNLTHPNIIRIFDAGEDQEVAYIAMELLDGEDLKRYCEKAHMLTLERAIEIVIQVAFGLDYAHKQGVVHRDIKPGNIMLLKDGTLRITDFGIARIQSRSKTATGAVLGTPAYMSPEQVNGKKVDGRADIFSLGVMLFELVTGEKPFAAETIAALLYRIANVDHSDPREFNKKLPPELVNVINKSLAKDAAQRYQTAGELGSDLRTIIRNMTSKNEAPALVAGDSVVTPPAPAPLNVTAPAPVPAESLIGAPVTDAAPAEPTAAPVIEQTAHPVSSFSISQETPTAADVESNNQVSEALRDAFAAGKTVEAVAPDAPPTGFETTRHEAPAADAEKLAPPEGFEKNAQSDGKPPVGVKTFTEADFLADLEKTFNNMDVTSPAPKGPTPLEVLPSRDVSKNAAEEDAFLQALNPDETVPPEGPAKLKRVSGDDTISMEGKKS